MEKFSDRLTEALAMRNMKPAELARRLQTHRGSVTNWLKDRYRPNTDTMDDIAEILDVNTAWLCGYDVPIARYIAMPFKEDIGEAVKSAYLHADERMQRIIRELLEIDL